MFNIFTTSSTLRLVAVGLPDAKYEARFERRARSASRGRPK